MAPDEHKSQRQRCAGRGDVGVDVVPLVHAGAPVMFCVVWCGCTYTYINREGMPTNLYHPI